MSLLNSNFSNGFEIVWSCEIDRYDVTSSVALFGFCTMMICAILKLCGIHFSWRHILKFCVINTISFFGDSFSAIGDILSIPGEFFGLIFLSIAWTTSSRMIGPIFSSCLYTMCGMKFRWISCGRNVCSSCLANRSTFLPVIIILQRENCDVRSLEAACFLPQS